MLRSYAVRLLYMQLWKVGVSLCRRSDAVMWLNRPTPFPKQPLGPPPGRSINSHISIPDLRLIDLLVYQSISFPMEVIDSLSAPCGKDGGWKDHWLLFSFMAMTWYIGRYQGSLSTKLITPEFVAAWLLVQSTCMASSLVTHFGT